MLSSAFFSHKNPPAEKNDWLSILKEAAIIILIMYFLFFPMKVEGSSMYPLFSEGSRVMVCRVMGWFGIYSSGDIIIFKKDLEGEKKSLIKRVVAEEGDEVTLNSNGLFVNGILLGKEYGKNATPASFIVPKNTLYVVGDNPKESFDSRNFGVIEKSSVTARVLIEIYPDFELYL